MYCLAFIPNDYLEYEYEELKTERPEILWQKIAFFTGVKKKYTKLRIVVLAEISESSAPSLLTGVEKLDIGYPALTLEYTAEVVE